MASIFLPPCTTAASLFAQGPVEEVTEQGTLAPLQFETLAAWSVAPAAICEDGRTLRVLAAPLAYHSSAAGALQRAQGLSTEAYRVKNWVWLLRRAIRAPFGVAWMPHGYAKPLAHTFQIVGVTEGVECLFDVLEQNAAAVASSYVFFDVLSGQCRTLPLEEAVRTAFPAGEWWITWSPEFQTRWVCIDEVETDGAAATAPRPRSPVHMPRPYFSEVTPPPPLAGDTGLPHRRVSTLQECYRVCGIPEGTQARHKLSPSDLAPLIAHVRSLGVDEGEALELELIFRTNALFVHNIREARYLAHELMVSDAQRAVIATAAQRGPSWHNYRGRRWTGSRLARVAGMGDYADSRERILRDALYPVRISTPAMLHGTQNEPRALRGSLAAQNAALNDGAYGGVRYVECGFLVNKYLPWMGASPDMLVAGTTEAIHGGINGSAVRHAATPLNEAYLPANIRRFLQNENDAQAASAAGVPSVSQFLALGELKCPFRGTFYEGGVRYKNDYYAQLHCNMAALQIRTAVFTVHLTDGAQRIEHIAFDDDYWNTLVAAARESYFNSLLPRLIWKEDGLLRDGALEPDYVLDMPAEEGHIWQWDDPAPSQPKQTKLQESFFRTARRAERLFASDRSGGSKRQRDTTPGATAALTCPPQKR